MEPTFTPLRAFCDSRGFSYFNIFGEITSGQINIGNLTGDAVKAFHYHKLQTDHWFCFKGDIHVILVKEKPIELDTYSEVNFGTYYPKGNYDILHYYIGEHNPGILSIPPFWWHGYRNVSQDSSLLYWVTEQYNPNQVDEYREPWNCFGPDLWQTENK